MICSVRPRKLLVLQDRNVSGESFQVLEPRLHLRPAKGVITNFGCPLVIIIAGPDGVHAEVDGGAPAESLAAGIVHLSAAAMFLWCRFVPPVHLFVHERRPALPADTLGVIVISAASFQQQHARFLGGLGQ